jgi:hypothetical protein
MTWFEALTGCSESSPEGVREHLMVDGSRLLSRPNGKSWLHGDLETPTLAQLRERAQNVGRDSRPISVREVIANAQHLHQNAANRDALFQVASQFNLLEMMAPDVTPEWGIGIYERDPTQGPACAIAAGAGTIFRNYFIDLNGRIGQSVDNQIDCLAGIGTLLGNDEQRLWRMVNGYALPSAAGLQEINQKLNGLDDCGRDRLRQSLQIGLQWDTQVTLDNASHTVSQAYCSALPIAYTDHALELWAPFATLVLEASYEATICAAIENAERTGNDALFLTLVGGGAFGNELDWIMDAIRRALNIYSNSGLDIAVVGYSRSKPCLQQLVSDFAGTKDDRTKR